ncbi:septum formation inhibitor Maf [Ketobacter sp. MCCC 1A13808]|uniref:Maf family protein n=1 Tax=Ketobacter sp. MCCC 1A13808 TaxID=2602738 RepID=UPI000F1E06B6|nr:Maf family protein [Ketobacter sp. MCCC 1A13808]MVF11261.1 septum formation inhibitor Maf [Ketobacter sp. MCCC 1A13808]RLP53608.1 MAG: septum formation inhibitor Maf [Ketobacter sp.]
MMYLASASPRRKELLLQIGVQFDVLPVSVDETPLHCEPALDYVQRMAQTKAEAGRNRLSELNLHFDAVLGADTIGVLDSRILVKPTDKADAIRMLLSLSGRTHRVITAIALATASGVLRRYSSTEVVFREISEQEAGDYWDTGEPQDKAGGYGIQGLGAVFVERIAGSYSGVVGLPLYETSELIKQAAVSLWQPPGIKRNE